MTKKTESRIPIDDLLIFHQVARSLTSSLDIDTILRTIIEHMERFIDAELWTLLMLDEERQELYYAIAAGADEAALRGARVKVGEGVAGWVVQHGETLLVPEADHDPRVQQTHAGKPRKVPGDPRVDMAPCLAVPGRPCGRGFCGWPAPGGLPGTSDEWTRGKESAASTLGACPS